MSVKIEKTMHEMSLREMMNDSSATGMILNVDKSWRDAYSKLYYEFLKTMQAHPSELQIFDTISYFIQNCTDTLDLIRKMQAKVSISELLKEELALENERNTWRLIHCLYRDRLFPPDSEMAEGTDTQRYISEKNIIENYYKSDHSIREFQLIVDWLEKNALDQIEKEPSIEHFTDKTIAWENTLHQLQNSQYEVTFTSSRPIVSSLDPDAPIREGKPLHDLDQEDDTRLEKRMFLEIRCGRLRQAQSLAMHCGQPWRAACLLGWMPYHDPNYNSQSTGVKLPVEGNANRSLWKLNSWELSEDNRVGQFYRGIYASLCGNSRQVLPLAQSWQDGLWAHMKSLLDVRVEKEVRDSMPKNYTSMPDDYWKNEMDVEDIFNELQSSKNPLIRMQAMEPSQLIQKYLILDQIPQLMDEVDKMLESNLCHSQFLRFLAHLVLFLRQIRQSVKHKVVNKILLSYVRVLIDIGDPTLVAYYTATLSPNDQISNYASFLEKIKDHDERIKCLAAAEETNLNVEAITKLVVENIRQKNLEQSLDLKGEITEADIEKIEALDWLIFYPSQREEALWQTNALIRYFLTSEKIDAARQAFNKIPQDCIQFIVSEYPAMDGTIENFTMMDSLPQKASCSIREYLCYRSYLDAQEGFDEWFTHFHDKKPQALEELPKHATFTEKVAYDHKKAQYNSELEHWKSIMQNHTKEVKKLLFNILLFPEGGWLVDSKSNETKRASSEEMSRQHQMERLRELCLPKITFLLYRVMSEMNEHAECVQLANTLASEQYCLYQVFPKEKLREVLRQICESSLVLMNQKKDPWGYSK